MKIETGVMAIKDGKAWGVNYQDGHSTSYGWIAPEDAKISDPRYCTRPTDMVHPASSSFDDLATARLVRVTRTTTVTIHE